MKKMLLISSLVLVIVTSMVSGTLALYNVSIPTVASGSVVAKEFVLLEDGTDTFTSNVKIAPTEKKEMTFAVKNNNGSVTSEVGMHVNVALSLAADSGKAAIVPLTVKVYEGPNSSGTLVSTTGSLTGGVGTLSYTFDFAANTAKTNQYTVVVEWPSNDAVDTAYAGAAHGTALNVAVTGTQF